MGDLAVRSMGCAEAERLVSDAADGRLSAGDERRLDEHLAACPSCFDFAHRLERVRARLRVVAVTDVPDLAHRVRASIEERRDGTRLTLPLIGQAAAVFLTAFAVAAASAWVIGTPRVAVADISERVAAAQAGVKNLQATLEIVEYGWHPEVEERRYSGRLDYNAPETLLVHLRDSTTYPTDDWAPNDVTVIVAEETAWSSGPAPCPTAALPGCTPPEPRAIGTRNGAPFTQGARPLDLVVPARSFSVGNGSAEIGTRQLDGRDAVGVEVSVAQIQPLLDALLGSGNWRELHPADTVELWLDETHLVPLSLEIRAVDGSDRERWAAPRGLRDEPGQTLLRVDLTVVAVNVETHTVSVPPPPHGLRDAGFRDQAVDVADVPIPTNLPSGLTPHRSGVLETPGGPRVAVRSWSDGRAWVTVRATREWTGGRLFGDLGTIVREVALPTGGLAYVGEGGHRVAIHSDGLDLVVEGSIGTSALLDVAGRLGVAGREVPRDWAEGATLSVAELAASFDGLLVPEDLAGFAAPGIRFGESSATLAYHGPGERGFVVIQTPGEILGPPLDDDVRGVVVRGTTARYTPSRNELEWVENGRVITMRSRTLTLEELAGVATTLRPYEAGGT